MKSKKLYNLIDVEREFNRVYRRLLGVSGGGTISDPLTANTEINLGGFDLNFVNGTFSIESAPIGSSLFPTTGTGTATGNVIGNLDGNTLSIEQSGIGLFVIDPTAGQERITIQAVNNTAGGNFSGFGLATQNTEASFSLGVFFNGSTKQSIIDAFADANSAALEYIADTHTFIGAAIIIPDLPLGDPVVLGQLYRDVSGFVKWSEGP